MTKSLSVLIAFFVLASGNAFAAGKAKKTESQFWSPDQVKWEKEKDAPVSMAVLWGDAHKGAHFGLTKFDKGAEFPKHTHSASNYAVVVSGTLIITLEDGKEMMLTPGSAGIVAGKAVHTTKCAPEADCVIAGYVTGKEDMIMADKTAAKK